MNRFENKVAVVTGGANGIGLATAQRLAREGAKVAVLDLERIAPEVLSGGPRIAAFAGDCTNVDVLKGFFDQVTDELGPIDVLFNNVGQSGRDRAGLFLESAEEVWRFVIEINLISTMRSSRLVAPGMKSRGWGRIINMSSDAALSGDLRLADYATAKMGIVGFTRALATELAPAGVTVNAICPGAISTRAHERIPQENLAMLKAETPVGFIATPQEVGGLVAYLASDEARFVNGQTIAINGGRNYI